MALHEEASTLDPSRPNSLRASKLDTVRGAFDPASRHVRPPVSRKRYPLSARKLGYGKRLLEDPVNCPHRIDPFQCSKHFQNALDMVCAHIPRRVQRERMVHSLRARRLQSTSRCLAKDFYSPSSHAAISSVAYDGVDECAFMKCPRKSGSRR